MVNKSSLSHTRVGFLQDNHPNDVGKRHAEERHIRKVQHITQTEERPNRHKDHENQTVRYNAHWTNEIFNGAVTVVTP